MGFLRGLGARAVGVGDGLRPRHPSRFERPGPGGPGLDVASDVASPEDPAHPHIGKELKSPVPQEPPISFPSRDDGPPESPASTASGPPDVRRPTTPVVRDRTRVQNTAARAGSRLPKDAALDGYQASSGSEPTAPVRRLGGSLGPEGTKGLRPSESVRPAARGADAEPPAQPVEPKPPAAEPPPLRNRAWGTEPAPPTHRGSSGEPDLAFPTRGDGSSRGPDLPFPTRGERDPPLEQLLETPSAGRSARLGVAPGAAEAGPIIEVRINRIELTAQRVDERPGKREDRTLRAAKSLPSLAEYLSGEERSL